MTYIYVKKDLTFIQDPASQSLLKAFLKAVYSDEYKNLAGEKIIVPSSTAFDPTKEDRTGSMASIRDGGT